MIYFFPDLYEDELFFGLISRYHYYSGNLIFNDTANQLFGSLERCPIELAIRLEFLVNELNNKYDIHYFISKHTMLPICSPFIPQNRADEIIQGMKFGGVTNLAVRAGLTAGRFFSNIYLKYCPICSKEEAEKYGDVYFHRIHQIPGISICYFHDCLLRDYPEPVRYDGRKKFVKMDLKRLDFQPEYEKGEKIVVIFKRLLKIARYLFNNYPLPIFQNDVHDRYNKLLKQKNLITFGGVIKQQELYKEFRDYYSNEFLDRLQSNFNVEDETNWLKLMTRKAAQVVHPMRHLLFINFLCERAEDFFEKEIDDISPFGNGPWPCLNRAAGHYMESVVTDCRIKKGTRMADPMGYFYCTCGFIYSRRGPDSVPEDRFRITRTIKQGVTWENKLSQLLAERKYSINKLARIMGCHTYTIVQSSERLGMRGYLDSNRVIQTVRTEFTETKSFEEKKQKYRNDIQSCINRNAGISRMKIKEKLYKQYKWLMQYDNIWLKSILPEKLNSRKPFKNICWANIDQEIVTKLKQAYITIIHAEKPRRISKAALLQMIGHKYSSAFQHLDRLPQTKQFLNDKTETLFKFSLRRIDKICEQLKTELGYIDKKEVLKRMGRNKYVNEIRARIDYNIEQSQV